MNLEQRQAKRERIDYLYNESQKLTDKMSSMNVGIDPQHIKDMRFELLIKVLLGDEEDDRRLDFEERFQESLNSALKNTFKKAEAQVRLSRLHVPGRNPNGGGGQQ